MRRPTKNKIAFLTMDSLEGFVAYDDLAHAPLAARGWHVDNVSWRAENVRWDDYALVVIRSPWDYQREPSRFLSVLQTIADSAARLENSLPIVRWNLCKTYLRDLQERGVPIVPTRWLPRLDQRTCFELISEFGTDALVVKPWVGANADDTFWLQQGADELWSRACEVFREREVMVQPFIRSVIDEGEFSLFFFAADYSHCILKTPKPHDFRVQEEHGATIRSVAAEGELIAAARHAWEQTVAAVGQVPLYARVDLVRLPDGRPAVMELELIEPSLYLGFDPQSPDRLADAIVRVLA